MNNAPITNEEDLVRWMIRPPRLLFVDDHDDIRRVFRLLAGRFECQWDEAGDGEEAIQLFVTNVYDLVILDMRMPGMDGFDVFREINKRSPTTPVCFLTGLQLDADLIGAIYEVGWATFARKPVDFNARFFKQLLGVFGIHLREDVDLDDPSLPSFSGDTTTLRG
jgi:CheY-like chemotaxis protein